MQLKKNILAFPTIMACVTGCAEDSKPSPSFEKYQLCIKAIYIEDETLRKSRTLACRRETSTLSESYIPFGNTTPLKARVSDTGRSLEIENLKNEHGTKLVAGVEIWVAYPKSTSAKCDGLNTDSKEQEPQMCDIWFVRAPVWLAPGEKENVIFTVGVEKLGASNNWSWGFQSYRYFEMSPNELRQQAEIYDRNN